MNANALNGTVFFPAQQKGEFSLWMSGWGTLTGEASYTYGSLVHTADPQIGLGAFNKQGYSNPEVDKLLQEGARTMDDTKRRALFDEKLWQRTKSTRIRTSMLLRVLCSGRVALEPSRK